MRAANDCESAVFNIWKKKFSIGLVLDTSLSEFREFLEEYHMFIDNIYFSLPMGDRFHSRSRVSEQMRNPETIRQFWEQLHLAQAYGITLEVLFNTPRCTRNDIATAKELMDMHGISPKKIGILDEYYDIVHEIFPGKQYVYSFNNRPKSIQSFLQTGHDYHEYVLGRQFIRAEQLMHVVREKLSAKVVLLANNGCSHICGGCSTFWHCFSAYRRAQAMHGAEYVYALQSVLPFEFVEGLIDMHQVDIVKINSRNTTVSYLRGCLDSYMSGNEEKYLWENIHNWSFWGSLSWHVPHYQEFDFSRIRSIKRKLYSNTLEKSQPVADYSLIWMDLSDYLIFERTDFQTLRNTFARCKKEVLGQVGGRISAAIIGVRSCKYLLERICRDTLLELLRILHTENMKALFIFPPCSEKILDDFILRAGDILAGTDALIVSEEDSFSYLKKHTNLPVWYGFEMGGGIYRPQPYGIFEAVECLPSLINQCRNNSENMGIFVTTYASMCRNICPIKRNAFENGACGELICLHNMGKKTSGVWPEICNLELYGDLLCVSRKEDTAVLRTLASAGVSLIIAPDKRWENTHAKSLPESIEPRS